MTALSRQNIINLLHICFAGPLYIYVGLNSNRWNSNTQTYSYNIPQWFRWTILAIGIGVLIYHAYKWFKNRGMNIHVLHIVVAASLLIGTGIMGPKTPLYSSQFMIIIGIGLIGFHLLQLITK